ncbi:conserved hypothetical protein [Formosa agariphila KMM 3901]|uniref:Uncharacterized protein n=2 Tax=Formosa TaxID=225842 RepID=T2KRS7_FORAG|nr:conserved hypothetical protein [Formosa agariphila KMM 3901]
MLKLKTIYQFSFLLIFVLIFLLGGSLQFFLGVSNTGLTLALCLIMLSNYALYVLIRGKIVFDKVVGFAFLYSIVIIISGVINHSTLFHIVLYNIFSVLPLSCYLFFKMNKNENYIQKRTVNKLVLYVAIIQLPILLIQRNFYDILIHFNNSGQQIASFDFLFGSFFLKSDHSLGLYLFLVIASLYFNINNIRQSTKYTFLLIVYLSITLLLAESNISKGLLFLFYGIIISMNLYKAITRNRIVRKIMIGFIVVLGALFIYNIRNIELITSRLGGTLERNFTAEKSLHFFNLGTAKREQIVIAAIHVLDTKYIGDGPYSYFDISTGKFKNTIHFTQLIWTYFDLGLIGLFVVILYMYFIIKTLNINNRQGFYAVCILALIYMFYTTPFSEIGIIFSLILFFNFYKDERNYNSIS